VRVDGGLMARLGGSPKKECDRHALISVAVADRGHGASGVWDDAGLSMGSGRVYAPPPN
jgi:hypothetical protein